MIEQGIYSNFGEVRKRGMSQVVGPADGLFHNFKLKLQRVRSIVSEGDDMADQMMSELEACDRDSSASDSSASADSAYVSDDVRTSDFDKQEAGKDSSQEEECSFKTEPMEQTNSALSESTPQLPTINISIPSEPAKLSTDSCVTTTAQQCHNLSPHNLNGSNLNVQGSSHNVKGSPLNIQGSPLNIQGSPHNVQGSPHNVQGSPHNIQGSPHNVQGSPHNVQGSQNNIQVSPHDIQGSPCSIPKSPQYHQSSPHGLQASCMASTPSTTVSWSQTSRPSMDTSELYRNQRCKTGSPQVTKSGEAKPVSPVSNSSSIQTDSPASLAQSGSSPVAPGVVKTDGVNVSKCSSPVSSGKPVVLSCPPGYMMQFPGTPPPGMKIFPMISLSSSSLIQVPTSVFLTPSEDGYLMSTSQTTFNHDGSIITYPTLEGPKVVRTEDVFKLDKPRVIIQSHLTPEMLTKEKPIKKDDSSATRLEKDTEFISHYTNGAFVYRGHLVENPHNMKPRNSDDQSVKAEDSDGEEPLVCAICNDRATGLHYGIITCEGCKGFFKRTVQNKRVYACVADSDCEINKAQRNRCQYCRFKKCLKMGMVLAAVREDRMPGGRNSGAVYNLCKVKYKKHKRRDNCDKNLRHSRLPTCKLEMPDNIPGYPTSDSAYDSATDGISDSGSTQSMNRSYGYPFFPNRFTSDYESRNPTSESSNPIKTPASYSGFNFSSKPPMTSYPQRSYVDNRPRQTVAASRADSSSSPYPLYTSQASSLEVPYPHLMSKSKDFSQLQGAPYNSYRQNSTHPRNPYYFGEASTKKFSPKDTVGQDSDRFSSSQNQSQNLASPCRDIKMRRDDTSTSARDSSMETGDSSDSSRFDSGKDSVRVKQEYDSGEQYQAGGKRGNNFHSNGYPRLNKVAEEVLMSPFEENPQNFYIKSSMMHNQDNSRWEQDSGYQTSSHQSSLSSSSSSHSSQPFVKPSASTTPHGQKRAASDEIFKNPLPVAYGGSSLPFYASPIKLMVDLSRNDCLLTIAEDYHIDQFTGNEETVAQALCQVGDNIVMRFVKWMKHLPFYREIPKELQSEVLMSKWHELLLLIMTAHGPVSKLGLKKNGSKPTFDDLFDSNMSRMQEYLQKSFGKFFTMDQLRAEIGALMEKVTHIMAYFWQLGLTRMELLCLMVILLLSHDGVRKERMLHHIASSYRQALQQYILEHFPSEANRLGDLLSQFSAIRKASAQLLASKMIYIPFLLNSN